ncbi:MAG: T9SS type A sorting domain-containing protein [Fibrobacter sp.]|nr:T9SS type A sorting domain-containing protein [Fibrobacter sp.]
MSIFRSILTVGLLCSAASAQIILTAPAYIDDFNDDLTGSSPHQTSIGEAYGSITQNAPWEGGGYWYSFKDTKGSTVKNGAGDDVVSSNGKTINTEGFLHVALTTSTSSDKYGYAAIGCNLIGEGDYVDLSKMTALSLKVKGSGTVRLKFETDDWVKLGETWGEYGYIIELTADWKTVNIPVASIVPEEWGPLYDKEWTWSHGADKVSKMAFQAKYENGDVELYADDIQIVGMTWGDFGWEPISVISSRSINNGASFNVNASSISFNLSQNQKVDLAIHDILGNKVLSLYNGNASAKTISFNSNSLSAGRYLVVLNSKNGRYTQPINVAK